MIKEITAVGKDIIEAKDNARIALGAGELDDVQFEIIDGGTKGILGLFARPAKVRAFIELPEPKEKKERNRQKKNKNQGERKPEGQKQKQPKPEKKASAPKSEVIPEEVLKMERRIVEAGEDMSYDFVKTLISDIGLSAEAELYSCEDGTRRIAIVGEDASVLIGHHGDTLDALQYLANLASARKNSKGERDKSRVTIDIEGYRKKREETLRALARKMAAKALRNKRSVMLEPMNAYERRIIHSEIQGIEGVSTNSIGSDNNRKIVIFLTDKKPEEIFESDAEANEVNEASEA
ncbi:MAG: KH domain-containing protein [Ruminococcaceae bacterium]|nr:KH domain-containing protein [Oscillospiraceae bacterium]